MHRVLIVDDERSFTRTLGKMLEGRGFVVRIEADSTRALEVARDFQPDAVLLDYLMPNAHGGDVAWQLASDPVLHTSKIIIISGVEPDKLRLKLPPQEIPILGKPFDTDALLRLLG